MADFELLETQKRSILAGVDGWSAARLAFRPGGSWSAVDMFDHLMRSERAILERLPAGIASPHKLNLRDRVGYKFVDTVFRSNRQVKTPSSVPQIQPGGDADLPSVCAEWDRTRRALAEFLSDDAVRQVTSGVFRHPVSGWMTLDQVLEFFSVHILHHEFQLARIAEASAGLQASSTSPAHTQAM